jgi:hypothetical protein
VISADLLTLGGDNVSAFAGVDGGTSDRVGLSLGQVDFALALISDRADPSRKFTSLQATAGLAAFVGVDSLTVAGTDMTLEINRGIQTNQAAIPAASGNSTYRLAIGADTFGTLMFGLSSQTASATIAVTDSDAAVASKVRAALETRPGPTSRV